MSQDVYPGLSPLNGATRPDPADPGHAGCPMDALSFLAKARSLECRHIAVIYGGEGYLRRRARSAVQQMAIGQSAPELCLSEFRGDDVDMAQVLDQLATPLLFAPRSLVVVEDADALVSGHRPLFERYADTPRSNSVLLLTVSKWPGNTRVAKIVARTGYAVDCAPLRERHITPWCTQYAKQEHHKALAPPGARLLVELVGTDMGRLASQIDKLSAYVGRGDAITQDDVDALVGRQRVRSTWELMDAASDGQPSRAVSILERLLTSGESPVMILGAIGWQLRRMVRACDLLSSGQRAGDVCRTLNIPPFVADRFVQQVRRLGQQRIRSTYRMLLDVDLGVKGASALSERLLLERLIVCLCRTS